MAAVVDHLKQYSVTKCMNTVTKGCVYYLAEDGEESNRCAFGWCVSETDAIRLAKEFPGYYVQELVDGDIVQISDEIPVEFLSGVQSAHDESETIEEYHDTLDDLLVEYDVSHD